METKLIELKEFVCNRYAFKLIKSNNNYMLLLDSLNKYNICNVDNKVMLIENGPAIIFNIINNINGSVSLKVNNQDLYMSISEDKLVLAKKDDNEYNFEFYLEDIGSDLRIEETAVYSTDGKFIDKVVDALGNEVIYDIDSTSGLMKSITNAKGKKTTYEYTDKKQIKSILNDNKRVDYTYDNNLLSSIKTGNKNYTFTYDNFLNQKDVKINNHLLSTNIYDINNGNLIEKKYGNKTSVKYEYDNLNRLSKYITESNTYDYLYNNFGLLADNGFVEYKYDFDKRLIELVQQQAFRVNYEYDANSNIINKIQSSNYGEHKVKYDYNEDDSIIKVTIDDDVINNNYDYLGRLKDKSINGKLISEYTYKNRGDKTSLLIDTVKINGDIYKYSYDKLYNIEKITLNDKVINEYKYDDRNQLVEDINYYNNLRYVMAYDNEGNILKREDYYIPQNKLLNVYSYEYNNADWEDQLTKFNDDNIIYDEIGNPTKIGEHKLTWRNGRELSGIDERIKYYYNENGIRVSKTVDNKETKYYLEGTQIAYEVRGEDTLYYIRDENNSLIGIVFNGVKYYYKKNNQNDVIGLYDSNYKEIVKYYYDCYGNSIAVTDMNNQVITDKNHIGVINPYRYRSYYYDNETGYYYLNSRYYNPEWGRFINADGIIGTSNNIIAYNVYSYANNNPINYFDSDGKLAVLIVGGIVAVSVVGCATYNALKNSFDMFSKAIKNPSDISYDKKSQLATTVKKSKTMRDEIKDQVIKAKNDNLRSSKSKTYKNQTVYFYNYSSTADADAKLSVGHADYDITITEIDTKLGFMAYNVDIYMYDRYDFDNYKSWTSIANILNNCGMFLQDIGYLKKYKWDVSFTMIISEGELK